MRALILAFLVVFVVAGCASTQGAGEAWQQVRTEIPAGQARLYVVRPFDNAAAGNQYSIRINGAHMANMRTGSYFSLLVPAGEVKLSAATVPNIFNLGMTQMLMGRPELTMHAAEGELLFVSVKVAFSGGPVLERVETETGERLVGSARKIEALR